MLKRLIAEAAEPNALKLARRFHPVVRENIYRAAAISQRASQLIDAFPLLGIAIYSPPEDHRQVDLEDDEEFNLDDNELKPEHDGEVNLEDDGELNLEGDNESWWNKAPDAVKMVERGVRLKEIASFMDVPMWARKLKPAVAHLFWHVPDDLHCYLPEKTWEQRLMLRAFKSKWTDNPDFGYWIARMTG